MLLYRAARSLHAKLASAHAGMNITAAPARTRFCNFNVTQQRRETLSEVGPIVTDSSTGTKILTLSLCHTIKPRLPVRHTPHMCFTVGFCHCNTVGCGLLIGLRVCTVALFDEKSQRREIVFRTRKPLLTTDECAAVLQEVCLYNVTLFFPLTSLFLAPELLGSMVD